jgi:hypothetical protein
LAAGLAVALLIGVAAISLSLVIRPSRMQEAIGVPSYITACNGDDPQEGAGRGHRAAHPDRAPVTTIVGWCHVDVLRVRRRGDAGR